MLLVADDSAAEHVAVAGEILRQAVDDEVRAEFERPQRCSGVANVLSTMSAAPALARNLRELVDLADAQQRIRDRLHEDAAGLRSPPPRCAPRRDRRCRRNGSSTPNGSNTFISSLTVAP